MIIAIAGGTGSGKTTTANKLAAYYKNHLGLNSIVISMDNYYKNAHIESFENYDHPNAFEIDLLLNDLNCFLSDHNVPQRNYCYETKECYTLEESTDVDILILEGLYAFYDQKLRTISHRKLYLDIEEKTRLKRRLTRDKKERSISVRENMRMINGFVKKMHSQYVISQEKYADIVLGKNEDVDKILSSI